jgi:5'-methylthioadenosine phosphorylase
MNSLLPRIGIIGGSGLGNALLADHRGAAQAVEVETPFGKPSGPLWLAEWNGVPLVLLARHGPDHTIGPSAVPYRSNIWAMKALGCRWIIASGAVGSLREGIAPRDLVLVDQIIDKTTRREGTFFDEAAGAAVHVEFAEPICPVMRVLLEEASGAAKYEGPPPTTHALGTYVCMEGPAFSTRAESLMHRLWGGDLIGMTAMPEAKLAREAEMSYGLVALATDYDCWKPHEGAGATRQALLREIVENMRAATGNALALVKAAVPRVWESRGREFPVHRALELAIWTDKAKISAGQRRRLELLWGKYV